MDRIANLPWALISRYAIDFILIFLFIRWSTRKKRRRKKVLNTKALFRVALVYFSIFVFIPKLFGPISSRARYLPAFVEAHKLRLYYTAWSTAIPGARSSRSSIEREIVKVAGEYGFNPAFVKAVVTVESGFDQFALSPTGACGLMQLMPSTYYSLRGGNPFGARANLSAGTRYLNKLYKRFNGDTRLVLAAYNAGPSNVKRFKGIPPFPDTQRYVKNVMAHYERYKKGS